MARHAQVLLDLAELGGLDGHEGVLLAVDGAGLQRGEHLAEGHGHGIGAEGLERIQEDVVLHHAQLHAFEVLGLGDRLLAVREVAETVLPVGQVHETGGLELLVEVLARGAVEHRVGLLLVGEQERQVEGAEFLHDAHQRRARGAHHFLRARAQGLRGRQVAARGAAPEGRDLHLAAGLGSEHFLHLLHAHAHGVVFVHAVGELDRAFGKLREGACRRQQAAGHEGGGHQGSAKQHACLLRFEGLVERTD
ncbi:hypothetical protein D9M69_468160 [compost metagenome]